MQLNLALYFLVNLSMGILKQFGQYLFFKKSDNAPKASSIKFMHTINRISIVVFLICLVILAIKLLSR